MKIPLNQPDPLPGFGPVIGKELSRFEQAQLETEFSVLFETSIDFIWTVDIERFAFRTCNSAFRNFFAKQYGVVILPGMNPREYLPPGRAQIWTDFYQRALREGQFSTLYDSADKIRTYNVSFRTLKGADDSVFGISVFSRDVTDRKKLEAALRESDERFYHAFEYAAIGKALVRPDGHWLKVNRTLCDLFGYTPEEMISKTWQEITHPDDLAEDEEFVARMLRGEIDHYQLEKRYFRKSGDVLWAQLGVSLVLDEEGLPLYFVSQIQDITERRQAEEAVRRSEHELRSFIAHAPIGIVRSSISQDRLLSVNPAFLAMMGYTSPEEMYALRLSTDVYVQHAERPGFVEQLRSGGQFRGIELTAKRKDGQHILLRLSGRVRDDESDFSEDILDLIVEEVTQHRALEEQLRQSQKMEAIGLLAGGVSHDFNNLLSIIMGNVSLLLDETVPGTPEHAHGDAILEATRRAADLIRQLLTFSRKSKLDPVPLDLNAVIAELGRLIRRLVGRDMRINFDLSHRIGAIHADRGQIEQVLMNLATNARDAMPGGGEFTLSTQDVDLGQQELLHHPYVIPGPYVHLRVSDTGEGMSKEVQAHLFEPFFTTKPTGHGTGLGLATVYGIIKQNNGFIWVTSELGAGATFDIYLPRIAGKEDSKDPTRP